LATLSAAQGEVAVELSPRQARITDTAGVRRFDLLEEAVHRAGPGKILFGSDGPWLHPGVELAKIDALDLPDGERELIRSGNLLRLISGVRRQASRVAARAGYADAISSSRRNAQTV
jgi:predicted TIM-barrel fold metal-dependent hydrolase